MENLNWTDRVDGQDDIMADDTNTLAHAIITIINWINSNGNNGDIDLSNYVQKEEGKGLSSIANVRIENGADVTSDNPDYFKEIYIDNQDETHDFVYVYDVDQMTEKLKHKADKADLSDYYTKAEVEAYIEETLLGGAW
jgi:restriction endonuclease S subunit